MPPPAKVSMPVHYTSSFGSVKFAATLPCRLNPGIQPKSATTLHISTSDAAKSGAAGVFCLSIEEENGDV